MCVQPWFPQQTQLSGPFDCVYVTVTLFQEHVLFERSDKEAQGSSQTRRRGCRVKEVKVRYPQSDTQHLKHRAADREQESEGDRSMWICPWAHEDSLGKTGRIWGQKLKRCQICQFIWERHGRRISQHGAVGDNQSDRHQQQPGLSSCPAIYHS